MGICDRNAMVVQLTNSNTTRHGYLCYDFGQLSNAFFRIRSQKISIFKKKFMRFEEYLAKLKFLHFL
jgi:hypothetical protein